MKPRSLLWILLVHSTLTQAQVWLDPEFGAGGVADETFAAAGFDGATCAALQPDGKIVVAGGVDTGGVERDFLVARFNTDGALDTGFGTAGYTAIDVETQDQANGVALQDDGGIVVVGTSSSTGTDKVILRLTDEGLLDTSFNGTGVRVIDDSYVEDQLNGVAIQPDQKIVVVGQGFNGSKDTFYIARLNTNGSFDTTGFSGGQIEHTITGDNCHANAVAVMDDGHIVSVGMSYTDANTGYDAAVVRYNADGSMDDTFDGDGILVLPGVSGTENATSILFQEFGNMLVGGSFELGGEQYVAVARVLADGVPDPGWGISGWALLFAGVSGTRCTALGTAPDGYLLAAGTVVASANVEQSFMARFMGNAVLDPTFGTNGVLVRGDAADPERALAMLVQPDGKMVLAGSHGLSTNADVRLLRYLQDPATFIPEIICDNLQVHENGDQLQFTLPSEGIWTCRVEDGLGKVCLSRSMAGSEGSGKTMALGALPTGTYLLSVQQGSNRLTARFLHHH